MHTRYGGESADIGNHLIIQLVAERNRVEGEKRRDVSSLAALISNQATEFSMIGKKVVDHSP
jgi:hypothetical protein